MQCIVCHRDLANDRMVGLDGNQPFDGLAFTTSGHWPSSVIDGPNAPEINVCDGCLEREADAGRILEQNPREGGGGFRPPATYKRWAFPKKGKL